MVLQIKEQHGYCQSHITVRGLPDWCNWLKGSSYVNESMVTGELAPVLKEVNSLMIGGTINLHGSLHV
uniref:Putative P-type ATPase, A domain-containing protein n=1 Tax=Helianthus annuus TaxID=4232 RepID=A0A251U2V0_HELAN